MKKILLFTLSIFLNFLSIIGQTTLQPGDLAILAFHTNVGSGTDEISFVSFVDIAPGTIIDITDNAYEKCGTPNGWGISEGWIRLQRTTNTLPKGKVITVRVSSGTPSIYAGPDANWTCTKPQPSGQGNFDLNNGGEQIFFMTGGTVGGPNANTATSDAGTYSGYFLYGFNTKGNVWTPICANAAGGGTQNSAKPQNFDCFLVWPTASADRNKYTGPLTAATQREWIDRIGNPSNWTGYSSDAAYNAGPDYINFDGTGLGRTITINAGGYSSGVWMGNVSTDWFECSNWQNMRVPDATTNVTIDQSALNDCVVGSTGAAVCNNLNLSSNSGTNRNLTIQNTATLMAGGNITVNKSAGIGNLVLELLNSAQLTCQNMSLQGTAAGSENGILRIESNSAIATVNGNLTINTGGNLDMSNGSFGSPEGTLKLYGNWVNNEPETSFKQGESTIQLLGSANQTIDVGGSSPERFWNLVVNKSGGKVILNDNIEVGGSSGEPITDRNGVLTLTNRNIETGTNYLYVTNPAIGAISGGSASSFVDGNLRRHTNTASLYDFPVGEGTRYMRAGVRTTNTSENVIEVDAQNSGYGTYTPLEPMPTGLVDVSTNRWWDVTKISGTTPVNVRLYWMALADDGIVDATQLVVAHYSNRNHSGAVSTLQWWNRGRNAANSTGTIVNGYVESNETVSTYSPFTFGTLDPINPLPVELISFTGTCEQGVKTLRWATASEAINAFFSVQRSEDGINYVELVRIPGAGNSNTLQTYQYQDISKSSGNAYYKLTQTDYNGKSESFDPIFISCEQISDFTNQAELWSINQNQVSIRTQFAHDAQLQVQLMDISGRTLLMQQQQVNQGIGLLMLDVQTLNSGLYLITLQDGNWIKTLRFFIP